jgi:hypothetical protein
VVHRHRALDLAVEEVSSKHELGGDAVIRSGIDGRRGNSPSSPHPVSTVRQANASVGKLCVDALKAGRPDDYAANMCVGFEFGSRFAALRLAGVRSNG